MSDHWIKVRKVVPTHPKVFAIARLLDKPHRYVVGLLVEFWQYADTNTADGVIDHLRPEDLDTIFSEPGLGDALVEVGWLHQREGGGLEIPDFGEHMGESAKRRAMNTKAKSERRIRAASSECPPSRGTTEGQEGDQSKSKSKSPPPPQSSSPPPAAERMTALTEEEEQEFARITNSTPAKFAAAVEPIARMLGPAPPHKRVTPLARAAIAIAGGAANHVHPDASGDPLGYLEAQARLWRVAVGERNKGDDDWTRFIGKPDGWVEKGHHLERPESWFGGEDVDRLPIEGGDRRRLWADIAEVLGHAWPADTQEAERVLRSLRRGKAPRARRGAA